MEEKYDRTQIENLITNISSDIDDSLRKKITDSRLTTSILHNKKLILEYISKEKSKISKSIDNITYKARRGIDQYLGYLLKDPYDDYLRREAVESFINSSILGAWKHKSVSIFLDSKMYEEVRGLDPLNSFIKRAILLEYSFFLTDEIDRIKQIKNIQQQQNSQKSSNISKLKWAGKQTQLTELIKALIENGNIKIEKEGIISNEKNQKIIFETLTEFLNFKIYKPNKLIQNIKNRNNDVVTKFLDKLSIRLKEHFYQKNVNNYEENINQEKKIKNKSNTIHLKWIGKEIELTELTKALIENGNLRLEQEDAKNDEKNQKIIFDVFTDFLNFKIQNTNELIQEIRAYNKTPFIDCLSLSLKKYFSQKE